MKFSDGFDARRLRPRNASNWRLRLGAGLAALFAALGPLNESPATASVFVVTGLLLLSVGVLLWRRCRRRLRRPSDLSMAPHLMKKRD